MTSASVLSVRDLTLTLPEGGDRKYALQGLSFDLAEREILCIVGESGSGKSLCAQTIMGLLPKAIGIEKGEILLEERISSALRRRCCSDLRGKRVSMIFQEPMTALNPSMRIGDQIAEVFEAHGLLTEKERAERAVTLATEVGLPNPERIVRSFPHQLSGGQRQRAMIAMALALEPKVLIADEPTTALDVTTQAQILRLIRDIQQRRGMSVVFITHDFGVVADIADKVLVLQKGLMVEQGTAESVLKHPTQDYTKALLAAVPSAIPPERASTNARPIAFSVDKLCKTYVSGGGFLQPKRRTQAVNNVSFEIRRGETLGLIGEIRLRQIHGRPLGDPADRSRQRPGHARQRRLHQAQGCEAATGAQAHPDGLPGSLRLAQPAPQDRPQHRGWSAGARRRSCGGHARSPPAPDPRGP